jgi:membrane protein YqaA with SNARE-associated domain
MKENKKPNIVRRMYDWVLSWADTPYAVPALIILAFAESSFFPVPPDVLLIALALGMPKKSFHYAFYAALASVLGGILGYSIGHWGYEWVGRDIVAFYHGEAVMEKIRLLYSEYGFWGILTAAITPIPYKIFTIASGVFNFNFSEFMLASVTGRSFRFFAVSALIWKFGAPIKGFIDKYFNWLAILFTVLLIGGFYLVAQVGG